MLAGLREGDVVMNIRKIPALLLIAAIFIGVFTGCSYKVADEKNARKVYSCPKNNMFGLEKVVVFEDRVVVVLDKSTCDSGCGGLSVQYHYEHSPSSVTVSNATMPVSAVDWDNSIQTVKGRYIVTTKFDISSIQKKDQDKDITVTGINIQGKNIKINGVNSACRIPFMAANVLKIMTSHSQTANGTISITIPLCIR